jgi:hypothetical protein
MGDAFALICLMVISALVPAPWLKQRRKSR